MSLSLNNPLVLYNNNKEENNTCAYSQYCFHFKQLRNRGWILPSNMFVTPGIHIVQRVDQNCPNRESSKGFSLGRIKGLLRGPIASRVDSQRWLQKVDISSGEFLSSHAIPDLHIFLIQVQVHSWRATPPPLSHAVHSQLRAIRLPPLRDHAIPLSFALIFV